jgi:hypothetical protein
MAKLSNDRKDFQAKMAKDHEMVKGIFKFYEVPGGVLSFVFKKYKGDQVEKYDMVDGQIYTVPLCVAKHLNTNGWYPVHVHTQDSEGKPTIGLGTKKHRFGFQSLEFVDLSDSDKVATMGVSPVMEIFEMQQ